MQKDTNKANNNKKDVRKSYGDSSIHYKVAKTEFLKAGGDTVVKI